MKRFTFEGRFECGFDAIVRGKVVALVALYVGPGTLWGLGIAVANEPGYIPVPTYWCHADTAEEMNAHVDQLNRELFKLEPEQALSIIASTMQQRSSRNAFQQALAEINGEAA